MKNKPLSGTSAILAAIILLLAGIWLIWKKKSTQPRPFSESPETTRTTRPVKPGVPSIALDQINVPPEVKTQKYLESVGFDQKRFEKILKQKALVQAFKNKVKLEIQLPSSMDFIELELEDNVGGLYGSTLSGDKHFALLATPGKVKLDDVFGYLKDSEKALPLLKAHEFQKEKVQTVTAPEGTGLKDVTLIPSTTVDGKTTYAALAERTDGQGTYLFLMEASPSYFDANEEGLEKMLGSIRTKP